MLLHKGRFLDGMWSLYSFLHYCNKPLKVSVHDDGSLDSSCFSAINQLFPGVRIIDRAEADSKIASLLTRRQLRYCAGLRERLIIAKKLIDFLVMSEASSFIMLDSDVLTYSEPSELLRPPTMPNGLTAHLFSPDNNDYAYALPREVIEQRLGYTIAARLNSGLMNIQTCALSLDIYEECLRKSEILTDPRTSLHYAEQTVYAAVLPLHGAYSLSENRYTICGGPMEAVTAHYCGGGYWATRLYREGIPYLASRFGVF